MEISTDYYTDISLAIGTVSMCIVPLLTVLNILPTLNAALAAFAIVNTSTVGLMGAFVNYYGNVGGDAKQLFYTNAYKHALPAFIATVVLMLWDKIVGHKPNILITLSFGVIVFIVYFLIPNAKHEIGIPKMQRSYGLNPTQAIICLGTFAAIENILFLCIAFQ